MAVFVSTYGKRHIEQRFGDYDELIWTLPQVWDEVVHWRNKFWSDFGFDNPFDKDI